MPGDALNREQNIDAVFGALSDPMRRAILDALARAGGASASGLSRSLPITRQGVAKHLAVLEHAGLVERRRHGNEIRFRPDAARIEQATAWLSSLAAEWDDRLTALSRLALETATEPATERPDAGGPAAPGYKAAIEGGKR